MTHEGFSGSLTRSEPPLKVSPLTLVALEFSLLISSTFTTSKYLHSFVNRAAANRPSCLSSPIPVSLSTSPSNTSDQSPVSEKEAKYYYFGLPSCPRLVARSSSLTIPWKEPTGPEESFPRKQLGPGTNHAIGPVWEKLADAILNLLGAEKVAWTSLDLVGIGFPEEKLAPVVWVGIDPGSLSPVKGFQVALKCKELVEKNGIDDVHVEMRESIFINTFERR
ncbi:hypothetical protein NLI96_g8623 [Meripilus lineatus]|uniref:Uncharacterized protein n=1 Tax=Meripilus lineatus TaxID=2056292 RepID=A0AAD5UX99_9APHY|nr:hypothetical protein NLI96_g8623 [Physisporinus lineatus]